MYFFLVYNVFNLNNNNEEKYIKYIIKTIFSKSKTIVFYFILSYFLSLDYLVT